MLKNMLIAHCKKPYNLSCKLLKIGSHFPRLVIIIKILLYFYLVKRYMLSIAVPLLTNKSFRDFNDLLFLKNPFRNYRNYHLILLYSQLVDFPHIIEFIAFAILLSIIFHNLKIIHIAFIYFIISFYYIMWMSISYAYSYYGISNNITVLNAMSDVFGFSDFGYIIYLFIRGALFICVYHFYQYVYSKVVSNRRQKVNEVVPPIVEN